MKMCVYIKLKATSFKRCLMMYYNLMNDWNFELSLKMLHDPDAWDWSHVP